VQCSRHYLFFAENHQQIVDKTPAMPPKEERSSGVLIDHPLSEEPSEVISKSDRPPLSDDVATAKSSAGDKELWWIHGNGYDLQSFVARHPGGLEAILLGKGRDCTALVESYHAFSSQHATILEKYMVKTFNPKPTRDYFYDILKQRAANALKAQGIDPVEDRGAGWLRWIYYAVIVSLVLVTGYYHAKVRSSGRGIATFFHRIVIYGILV
jgi:hypothetical protein